MQVARGVLMDDEYAAFGLNPFRLGRLVEMALPPVLGQLRRLLFSRLCRLFLFNYLVV